MEKVYSEPVPIRDILDDKEHSDHKEVSDIMEKFKNGEITLCGCLGKIGNDPYCPCEMRAKGLVPTEIWTENKVTELHRVLSKYESSGK